MNQMNEEKPVRRVQCGEKAASSHTLSIVQTLRNDWGELS